MTIVGQAELDVRAVGAHFQSDIQAVVKPGMAAAGAEAEKTARGMSSSFGAVWQAFGAQSQAALGPVTAVVANIQAAVESISKNSSVAAKGMVAGAIGAGVGIGLQALGSGELAAQQQLQMSIENLGKSYDDYGGRIEKTIKLGERHGHTAEDTMRVLNQLTIATKDPAKALADYNVILDMAAVRHVPLQTAARMLSQVYAGNSRALKTFGIDLTAGTKALAAQKTATDAHATATTTLKKARQNLADVEARIGASQQGHKASPDQIASAQARLASAEAAVATARFKHGQASPQAAAAEARLVVAEDRLNKVRAQGTGTTALTVSQQIELRKAHEAVADAEGKVKQSATDMATAHKQAAGAVTSADDAVKLLADRVKGQADPSMNTFSGHLHQFWATAEDDLAGFGNKWGGTVTAISTGVLATSSILEVGGSVFSRFSKTATDSTSAVATDIQNMESSGRVSLGRLSGAVGGVAAAIGTFAVGHATAGNGAAGAAETTLMGAVSGAVIGLSVGGPLGAAIGGAVGALGGLADHFAEVAAQTDKSDQKMQAWMTTAVQLDKFKLGESFQQQLISDLQKHPAASSIFAAAGVNMAGILGDVRSGNAIGGPAGQQLQKAVASGKISQADYTTAIAYLQKLVENYSVIVQNLDDIATITGQTSQHSADVKAGVKSTVAALYGQPGASTSRPTPTLGGLLTPPSAAAAHAAHLAAAAHRQHAANTPTAAQLTSMHATLLQIQANTGHGTAPGKPIHVTALPGGRYRIGNSPELATLS